MERRKYLSDEAAALENNEREVIEFLEIGNITIHEFKISMIYEKLFKN